MLTIENLEARHNVKVLDHIERGIEVPILDSLQFQGDLAIIPTQPSFDGEVILSEGIAVVRGEAGGNTHLLLGEGEVRWQPTPDSSNDLGVVTVLEGAVAYLAHPEHAFNGMAPGSYIIRRQREQADQIRLVTD